MLRRDNNTEAFGYPDSLGWVCRNEFVTVLFCSTVKNASLQQGVIRVQTMENLDEVLLKAFRGMFRRAF